MLEFVRENFTGNPKFHPQMVMFILDTIVPRVEIEGVSEVCSNVSTLPVTVHKLASSVDAFESRLRSLKATTGLDLGGVVSLPINARKNRAGGTALMEGRITMGYPKSLETVQVMRDV